MFFSYPAFKILESDHQKMKTFQALKFQSNCTTECATIVLFLQFTNWNKACFYVWKNGRTFFWKIPNYLRQFSKDIFPENNSQSESLFKKIVVD